MFIRYLNKLQSYQLYCGNNYCELFNTQVNEGYDLFFKRNSFGTVSLHHFTSCISCKTSLMFKFLLAPPVLFIQPVYSSNEKKNLFILMKSLNYLILSVRNMNYCVVLYIFLRITILKQSTSLKIEYF